MLDTIEQAAKIAIEEIKKNEPNLLNYLFPYKAMDLAFEAGWKNNPAKFTFNDMKECWDAAIKYHIRVTSPHSTNVEPVDFDEWIKNHLTEIE